jgi:hypothetical protein
MKLNVTVTQTMKIITPPTKIDWYEIPSPVVFIAGSIEQDTAARWQDELISKIPANWPGTILNPRRAHWDATWTQSIDNPEFREQVEWELRGIEEADLVILNFETDTKSPITLLELGLVAPTKHGCAVVRCPERFWRSGNVDIVCARFGIKQVDTINDLAGVITTWPQGKGL